MEPATKEVNSLRRKILRKIEIEFESVIEEKPELKVFLDNAFIRLKKGILDEIGDCVRNIEKTSGNI